MKNINGQGNEITIILPHKKIDCISSHHEQFNQIIHQSYIIITGNNNHVSMHFDSEEKCTIFYRFSIDFRLPSPANHQSTITLHFSIRHIQEARNAISKLDMLFYCTQT